MDEADADGEWSDDDILQSGSQTGEGSICYILYVYRFVGGLSCVTFCLVKILLIPNL